MLRIAYNKTTIEAEQTLAKIGISEYTNKKVKYLSSGNRQRLAIGFAIFNNPQILILDEPTVGLDALTEQSIMETIKKLMAGRTTIMITHRLMGLEVMDQILVFDSGRIVEQGSQTELLAKEQLFYQLWHLQHDVL